VVVTTEWLIDKSAILRLPTSPDAETWLGRVDQGLVRVGIPTLLEIGFSARSYADWIRSTEGEAISLLPPVFLTPLIESRALEVQGLMARAGQHRAPSVTDLLIAALAEYSGLTVLHVDKDFDLIAQFTGQPVERLALDPDSAG